MAQVGTHGARWARLLGFALTLGTSACSASEAASTPDGGRDIDAMVDAGAMRDGDMPLDARADDASTDDASTDDAGLSRSCGAAPPRFTGALCGPGAAACVVLRDEPVEAAHSRNDLPSIALDSGDKPSILYSIAESGYRGMFAARNGVGAWTARETGFPLATGGFVFAGDTPTALAYDGAYHTDAYTLGGSGWTLGERLPTDQLISAATVVRDEGGCIHASGEPGTGMSGGDATSYLVRDTSWRATPVGAGAQTRPSALALAPSGEPHLAWAESSGSTTELRWSSGLRASEVAWSGSAGAGYGLVPRITVTSASGVETPHIVVLTPADDGRSEMRYATRASDGTWTVTSLDVGRPNGCDTMPVDGATCEVDGVSFAPVAIVSSGSGDVRAYWVRVHHTGRLTGRCGGGPPGGGPGGGPPGGPPPPICFWDGVIARDARLMVASPGQPSAEVETDVDLLGATAVLDGSGFLHIAAYANASSGTTVRYLMVGAPL